MGIAMPIPRGGGIIWRRPGARGEENRLRLSLGDDARHLHLTGAEARARYIVLAGLERETFLLTNGEVLGIRPLLVVGAGLADSVGSAAISIDLESRSATGMEIHLQAAAWPRDADAALPQQFSAVLTTALRDPSSVSLPAGTAPAPGRPVRGS